MSDIFISYAREDQAFAKKLAKALENKGWQVWWDRTIRPGEFFEDVIGEALEAARCVVVVWSKSSVNSDWVRMEAREGRECKKLVPLSIDESRIRWTYRRIQTASLANWDGNFDHPEYIQLVSGIEKIIGASPVGSEDKSPTPTRRKQPVKRRATTRAAQKPSTRTRQRPEKESSTVLRSEFAVLSENDVVATLKDHGFYDKDMNKRGKGVPTEFEVHGDVVIDKTNGLTWQRSGSDDIIPSQLVTVYILQLNTILLSGKMDWRLPTLEEALSLMKPKKNKSGLYIDPVFDSRQKKIWTCDVENNSTPWAVSFKYGLCVSVPLFTNIAMDDDI